jgi:hypothetical protein
MIERRTAHIPLPPHSQPGRCTGLVRPHPYLPTRHRADLGAAVTW